MSNNIKKFRIIKFNSKLISELIKLLRTNGFTSILIVDSDLYAGDLLKWINPIRTKIGIPRHTVTAT